MLVDVLLVDDHEAIREGLKMMIESPGTFRVIGQASHHREAIDFVEKRVPHLVVMDVSLPGLSGIETTSEILRRRPNTKVVILSMHEDDASGHGRNASGSSRDILKSARAKDLLEGLRMVTQGASYFSPGISDRILKAMQTAPATSANLTRREFQVLRLVAEGRTNKEIAEVLGLENETVRSYRKALMKKLSARNGAVLTKIAVSLGVVPVAGNGVAS